MLRKIRMLKRPHENDKTPPEPTTFHALASAGLELESVGRFAPDVQVVGATPTTDYPAASLPNADVGEEAPTGDDQRPEPVGTVSEIEASLRKAEAE
jgi:hypothetical protein